MRDASTSEPRNAADAMQGRTMAGTSTKIDYKELSDETLFATSRDDDMRAFDVIVHRYERRLARGVWVLLRNWEDAEEASLTALMGLFRGLKRLSAEKEGSVRAILMRSARNAAIDILRKRQLAQQPEGDVVAQVELHEERLSSCSPDPREVLAACEKHRALLECLEDLPSKHRIVVILRLVAQFEPDEVEQWLLELEFAEDVAAAAAAKPEMKIREIVEIMTPIKVTTVGGVGNILSKAKKLLADCVKRKLGK